MNLVLRLPPRKAVLHLRHVTNLVEDIIVPLSLHFPLDREFGPTLESGYSATGFWLQTPEGQVRRAIGTRDYELKRHGEPSINLGALTVVGFHFDSTTLSIYNRLIEEL